jgi:hypothetical protein
MGFKDLFRLEWPSWLNTSGSTPISKAPKDVQIGGELPNTFVPRISTPFPEWEDEVYNLNFNAYKLMRRCPAVIQPVKKLGERIAAMDLKVVGPAERSAAIQKIIKQAYCLPDAIKFLVWGYLMGVVFVQISKGVTREGPDIFTVPDFMGGARHKWKAGGTYAWDWKRIMKQQDDETVAATWDVTKEQEVRIEDHIIFRPGIGSSPEGDLDLAYAVFRLAERYELISKNIDAYADRHGLPREIIKKEMNQVAAANAAAVRNNAARSVANLTSGQAVGLSVKEALEYLEPSGTTADFLLESLTEVYGEVHRLILNQDLTSSTKGAGPAGSSQVHLAEEEIAVQTAARQIAECFNRYLLPWILRENEDIPELPEGEDECYIEFVKAEAEEEEEEDEDTEDEEPVEGADTPQTPEVKDVAQIDETMQQSDKKELEFKPNLHPNCMCEIVNGEWVTADNPCPMCIAAEIIHNLGGTAAQAVAVTEILKKRTKRA